MAIFLEAQVAGPMWPAIAMSIGGGIGTSSANSAPLCKVANMRFTTTRRENTIYVQVQVDELEVISEGPVKGMCIWMTNAHITIGTYKLMSPQGQPPMDFIQLERKLASCIDIANHIITELGNTGITVCWLRLSPRQPEDVEWLEVFNIFNEVEHADARSNTRGLHFLMQMVRRRFSSSFEIHHVPRLHLSVYHNAYLYYI